AGTVKPGLPLYPAPVMTVPALLGAALCHRNHGVEHGLRFVFVNHRSSVPEPAFSVAPVGNWSEHAKTAASVNALKAVGAAARSALYDGPYPVKQCPRLVKALVLLMKYWLVEAEEAPAAISAPTLTAA